MLNDTPFTPGWKEVMRQSRNEAGRLGHDYIGPEHFLLGIIRKGEGLAVQTLLNMDIDLEDIKSELERMLEVGRGPTVGIFPQNNEAKKVIETARKIAQQMKHNWIGTEHLLLALIREENTLPAQCLKGLGVDYNPRQTRGHEPHRRQYPQHKRIRNQRRRRRKEQNTRFGYLWARPDTARS